MLRTTSTVSTGGSVPVQVYFARNAMQYHGVNHFEGYHKLNPTFFGFFPKGGGKFIEFRLRDTTIPQPSGPT